MKPNRSGYTTTPAGSARALDQKPKPRKPKKELNQIFLLLFFIILPVLLLLSLFFQPVRWLAVALILLTLAAMWLAGAFLFPGRMVISAVYGLLTVLTLISALSERGRPADPYAAGGLFVTPLPTVMETPVFASGYSTMGTSVPDDYYSSDENIDDAFSGYNEVSIQGGTAGAQEESGDSAEPETDGVYVPDVKSEAEIALENFMERWRKGIIADMVQYVASSWKDAQTEPPEQQLFWKFAQKPLSEWRQMSAPSGTDSSTARTITVQADVNYGGALRTYQYDAIVLNENGGWFVDPASLSSGVLVEKATPTPDPNVTPTPTPEPTPTPTPGPKTKLYYNKDGGKKYHLDPNCPSVASKYRPLKGTFKYGDLDKKQYSKLKPCDKCGAPERP